MTDKLRVHTLSKELNVSSKAILDKCLLEGVEGVTNHMSTLSAGLAETIREWFSTGEHRTAVETAAPVDLEKVRTRRRPSSKKKQEEEIASEGPSSGELVATQTEPLPEESTLAATIQQVEVPVTVERTHPPATTMAPAAPKPPESHAPVHAGARRRTFGPRPGRCRSGSQGPRSGVTSSQSSRGSAECSRPGSDEGSARCRFRQARPGGASRPASPHARSRRRTDASRAAGHAGPTWYGPAGREAEREEERKKKTGSPRRNVAGTPDIVVERLKEWNDRDLLERQERLQAASGRGIHARRAREKKAGPSPTVIAPARLRRPWPSPSSVRDLCTATGIGLHQLFPKFKNEHNMLITRNSVLPTDIAQVVMLDFGIELEIVKPKTELDKLVDDFAARERTNLQPCRPS